MEAKRWAAASARTLARRLRRERQAERGWSRAAALNRRVKALRSSLDAHWRLAVAVGRFLPTLGEELAAGRLLGCDGELLDEASEALIYGNAARHSPPPVAVAGVPRLPDGPDARALERLLAGHSAQLRREARPFVPDGWEKADVLLQALGARGRHLDTEVVQSEGISKIVESSTVHKDEVPQNVMCDSTAADTLAGSSFGLAAPGGDGGGDEQALQDVLQRDPLGGIGIEHVPTTPPGDVAEDIHSGVAAVESAAVQGATPTGLVPGGLGTFPIGAAVWPAAAAAGASQAGATPAGLIPGGLGTFPTVSSACSRSFSEKMWRARSVISRTWLEPLPREAQGQACVDAAEDAHSGAETAVSEAEQFFYDWVGYVDSEYGIGETVRGVIYSIDDSDAESAGYDDAYADPSAEDLRASHMAQCQAAAEEASRQWRSASTCSSPPFKAKLGR
ncbi:unnamed protein product [Prorocentrum cordatum]|uniref:Uncharacterized protein n=1 Tax=Prorocentrum cordatum TaxID=2364126 RepID=A0ABN9VSG4_9DINO|nr:unnamed protein product [Polarella glacialis]